MGGGVSPQRTEPPRPGWKRGGGRSGSGARRCVPDSLVNRQSGNPRRVVPRGRVCGHLAGVGAPPMVVGSHPLGVRVATL